ncbi:RepB family plasmid replication initiator protein (plasmid) [Flagellatimonas centrodinii]|uniref:replication initiation protein n=1 Tax=Flagellatimonas centrodinii TaxID=2806210 RepID=UPI001FF794C3|nr:RepB family plasmid replication initiator protein [Flagellatimonas centrodinii]ULQ48389.1 RepB family plasmid replication initiator protein [Flagellatimonas centrodinii]
MAANAVARATPDSYVIQANNLARGRVDRDISIHATRLLLVSISKVEHEAGDLFDQILISSQELREIFPSYSRSKALGTFLDEAADILLGLRAETYNGREGWRKVNLVRSSQYHPGRGLLVQFDPEMHEVLLRLKGRFTKYQLRSVASLSTNYQIVLYQFLRSYTHEHEIDVMFEDLRRRLNIGPTEYQRTALFIQRILRPALDRINETTDLTVTYIPLKEGRKYSGFRFKISLKEGEALSPLTTAAIRMLQSRSVTPERAREFGMALPLETILQTMAYAHYQSAKKAEAGQRTMQNLGAYIAKCLSQPLTLPENDAAFSRAQKAIAREFRMNVYELMTSAERDSIRSSFRAGLSGRLAVEWDRFDGPETSELKQIFAEHLATIISPESGRTRLYIGGMPGARADRAIASRTVTS